MVAIVTSCSGVFSPSTKILYPLVSNYLARVEETQSLYVLVEQKRAILFMRESGERSSVAETDMAPARHRRSVEAYQLRILRRPSFLAQRRRSSPGVNRKKTIPTHFFLASTCRTKRETMLGCRVTLGVFVLHSLVSAVEVSNYFRERVLLLSPRWSEMRVWWLMSHSVRSCCDGVCGDNTNGWGKNCNRE